MEYTISGTGSGILNGSGFRNLAYTLHLEGDTRNYGPLSGGYVVDPLRKASIDLAGLGTFTVEEDTRFGVNGVDNGYFSRPSDQGIDFFAFHLAAPVDLLARFGPVSSTRVFTLDHFNDLATSGGDFTLLSTSNVEVSGMPFLSAVPLPGSAPLLGGALLLLGRAGCRRRGRPAPV